MNLYEKHRYEMLVRVSEFGTNHRQQFPESSPAGKAFAVVGHTVAQLEAHAKARLLTKEEGKQARKAVRNAIEDRVRTVVRIARIVARNAPGADSKFQPPAQKSGVAMVTAARAFVDEGKTALERFVPFGMPATIIAELQELVDRYEQADRERRAGKDGFAKARAGAKSALAMATEALRLLDVVVATTLATDPAILGGWHEARRVEAPAKAVKTGRSNTEAKAAGKSETVPATPTGDAPVAVEPDPALRMVS